jgi:hypothetical protein
MRIKIYCLYKSYACHDINNLYYLPGLHDLSGKPNVGEGITLSDLEAHSRDMKDNDILKSLIPVNIG